MYQGMKIYGSVRHRTIGVEKAGDGARCERELLQRSLVDLDADTGPVGDEAITVLYDQRFVDELMKAHNVPELPADERERVFDEYMSGMVRTHKTAEGRMEVVYSHPQVKVMASALGVPPQEVWISPMGMSSSL